MKQFFLFRLLPLFLGLAALSAAAPIARADALDTFIGLYQDIEDEVGAGNLPISSAYLSDSRDYIRCIASGSDVLVCSDQYHDTGAGKSLAEGGQIPSGFWQALDAYVAYKQGDYWSAAYHLGAAAVCAAVQILAGGGDVCALLEELYEVAKGLYEGAGAVLSFLADVGEAAWDAISGAGEAICEGIGFCDDDDGPPLHAILLKMFYVQQVKAGVDARENTYAPKAFDNLRWAIGVQAKAWASEIYSSMPGGLATWQSHIDNSVATAAGAYTQAVDAAWTADITNKVWPELLAARADYKVDAVARLAANSYIQSGTSPRDTAFDRCKSHFSTFDEVDGWISHFPETAAELQIGSNQEWCGEHFDSNKYKFVEGFTDVIKANLCVSSGQSIVCDALDKFRKCTGLLDYVGQKQQCQVSRVKVGQEVAALIQAYFTSHGSTIPCQTISPALSFAFGPGTPVKMECTRPTQQVACDREYQKSFADLPTKVLECTLKKTADYVALEGKVADAVEVLNKDSEIGGLFGIPSPDPLLVVAGTAVEVPQRDWGFGPPSTQPGFHVYPIFSSPPGGIDGLSTPGIWFDMELPNAADKPVQSKFSRIQELTDPSGPITNPIDEMARISQAERIAVQADKLAVVSAKVQVTNGLQQHQQQQQQQQQVMSGTLPPNQQPPTSPALADTARKLTATKEASLAVTQQGSADLQMDNRPEINGKKVPWTGTTILDAATLKPAAGGRCQVPIRMTVKNAGSAASPASQIGWPGVKGMTALPPLAPGQSHQVEAILELDPGTHSLQWQLDSLQQVGESNESNNRAALTVRMTGSCSATAPATLPTRSPTLPHRTGAKPETKPLLIPK
ncbi:MAG: CARDB domain-containing protein [Syntrophotaleaceae bacterium]